jgi:acylphosphatase
MNTRAFCRHCTMTVTRHLTISGRVQGVGFRYQMQRVAYELGVTGWVRNRRDGSVEAMVQGAPDAAEAMIAWTRRGPPGAFARHGPATRLSGGGQPAPHDPRRLH